MTTSLAAIADEAYARINCYGIGGWLDAVFLRLGLSLPPTPQPWEQISSPRASGLVITIYRQPNIVPTPATSRDAFVLSKVEGDAFAPTPRGLDATHETLRSAMAKLSPNIEGGSPADIAAGDTRVSYFMPDGKVVGIRFNSSLIGFDQFVVVALGTTSAFLP